MPEHAAGQWEADYRRGEWSTDPGWWEIHAEMVGRRGVVADTLNRDHVISPEEDAAHARLIAAAPDLLAELKAAEWVNTNGVEGCPRCGYVREAGHRDGCTLAAAIAKAEGREGRDATP